MTKLPRPKLRMAPAPGIRAAQQASALEKLGNVQRLQAWSEEPLEPPTDAQIAGQPYQPPQQASKPAPEPVQAAPIPTVITPAPAKRPWEAVPEKQIHPFTMHLPESTYLKSDFCWKRTDYKSAKAFYVAAIEAFCAQKLKEIEGSR